MLFAQFYQKSAISDEIIEACGDRAVVIYSERTSVPTCLKDARVEARKRGYVAVAMFRGEAFSRSKRVTDITPVEA
ncbi:hypothetical protein [Pseudomonas mediterranea]|uniref:hypothetical protein n=1 Tax=Pseudomonas mediterranea TaxID=183795 RepID=UPI0006D8D281|nr:hypothetical protein [Pseudomonas mediterranea]